jgi:hypothetical protein
MSPKFLSRRAGTGQAAMESRIRPVRAAALWWD